MNRSTYSMLPGPFPVSSGFYRTYAFTNDPLSHLHGFIKLSSMLYEGRQAHTWYEAEYGE